MIFFLIYGILVIVIVYRSRKYLIKYQFEAISWYQQGKNILYICVPALFISLIFSYFPIAIEQQNSFSKFGDKSMEQTINFFKSLASQLAGVVILGFSTVLYILIRKESWFYITKIYLQQLQKKSKDIDKTIYFFKALDAYNNYVRKLLNIGFKRSMIYSKFFASNTKEKCDLISSVNDSFDKDKLGLINTLLNLITIENQNNFLYREKLINKISSFSVAIVPIIAVIVTVIGIILGNVFD